MAKDFDLLLTLFPFEVPYFSHTSLATMCTGHPVVEEIQKEPARPAVFLANKGHILALFPGSRPAEVKRNLPKQLAAAIAFCKRQGNFTIAIAESRASPLLRQVKSLAKAYDFTDPIHIVSFSDRYQLMKQARLS